MKRTYGSQANQNIVGPQREKYRQLLREENIERVVTLDKCVRIGVEDSDASDSLGTTYRLTCTSNDDDWNENFLLEQSEWKERLLEWYICLVQDEPNNQQCSDNQTRDDMTTTPSISALSPDES